MKKDITLCLALIGILAFTACNSSGQTASEQSSVEITSEQSVENGSTDDSKSQYGNMAIAKVTAVTDHSVSVVTAKTPEGQPQNKETPPNKNDGGNSSDTNKPSAPPNDGNAPQGNAPEGNAPEHKDGERPQGQPMEFNTEETLLEISDESILYTRDKDSETGCSLSDIKVDDVIRIEYADDGVTPKKIVVITQSALAGEAPAQESTKTN